MDEDELHLDGDSPACLKCAGGDPYVAQRIDEIGREQRCAICGEMQRTITVSELAAMVADVFKKYVRYADGEPWNTRTTTSDEIVQEILECDLLDLSLAIAERLSEGSMERALSDGGSLPYDPMSQYELSVPYETSFIEEWESFEHGVKHSGRFYLDRQREYIERIFRPLLNGELHRGKPPIIEIGAEGSDIQFIYRARAANTAAEQKRIFENPPRELAPPPATLRTAGRMNAAGVVAFYGATDATTCIAELAIPFGGAAVVGKFKCLRPLRVLDFRLLRSARMQYSYFDPTLTERLGYQHFMQSLRNLLRRPVLPGHEDLDYLPTQMIAEFLAHEGLDGAMFISSVTPEASDEAQYELAPDASAKDLRPAGVAGINIVVFSHAAGVVNDMGPPRRRVIRVHPPVEMEPPFDGWLYVEIGKGAPPEDPDPLPYPEYDDANEPTLELMEDEIVLAYPKKIEYSIVSMAPTFAVPEDDALTPF